MIRRCGTLLLCACCLAWGLAAAPAATAQSATPVQRAVSCLRQNYPVCVEPGANPGLTPVQVESLRHQIESQNAGPLYIAILPPHAVGGAGGSVDQLLRQVTGGVHENGTYAVAAGRELRAGSTASEGFSGAELATAAVAAHRSQGLDAILTDFVGRVAAAREGARTSSGSAGANVLLVLVALAIGAFALFHLSRRQSMRLRERQQVEEVKRTAREDLLALGDDIRTLDLDVEMPSVDRAAKDSYNRAVKLYDQANRAFDRARRPEDLATVTSALEEGRFEMAAAKARLEGRPPPERRPPCFFDPRHGPSVEDVEWAPPGGALRPVPACAACAQRVQRGVDPEMREVVIADQRIPYWKAPAYYRPWAGGFFGGFGGAGFLGGLLLGEMFGDGFGGWDDVGGGDFGGGSDFGGGGDFGGGDFGGGGDF